MKTVFGTYSLGFSKGIEVIVLEIFPVIAIERKVLDL